MLMNDGSLAIFIMTKVHFDIYSTTNHPNKQDHKGKKLEGTRWTKEYELVCLKVIFDQNISMKGTKKAKKAKRIRKKWRRKQ